MHLEMETFIRENRAEIGRLWTKKTLDSYPDRAADFFAKDRNRFSNPVGHHLREALYCCLDFLVADDTEETDLGPVAEFIKIRSVQEFKPSEAVGFIFGIKSVLRELAEAGSGEKFPAGDAEWIRVESRVDRLACLVFDLFAENRQKIYELRIGEIKRTGFRLLRKAHLLDPDSDPDIDPQAIGGRQ